MKHLGKLTVMSLVMITVAINSKAQSLRTGYKGFADAGYSIGTDNYKLDRIEVNTSHGYLFNPYIFLGAGVGLHFMQSYATKGMKIPLDTRDSKVDIPVFANIRFNLSKTKISPFLEAKGDTYITNNGGLYINLSAGCRFAINEKQGINISIGYALGKLEFEKFSRFTSHYNLNYTRNKSMGETYAITLKAGLDF